MRRAPRATGGAARPAMAQDRNGTNRPARMTETIPIPPIPILGGIAAIRDRYDAFIVDLWGVVHDGVTPYPGVIDCLQRLRADGKQVCLLSNAPRRVGSVVQRLAQIGVPEDCWDAILSSGEAAHLALAERDDDFHQ